MVDQVDLQRLIVTMEARSVAFERQIQRAQNQVTRATREMERRFNDMNRNIKSSVSRLAVIVGGAFSVREVAAFADAWTRAGNLINAAGQVAGRAGRSLEGINEIANATRSGFEDTAELYARLLRSTAGVAKSEEEVARATTIVNQAFKAGGAASSEMAAGILQLSQGLSSGLLQGDELRSVRENAPLLAQAIADFFGVTIGQLKKLGSEGKLTSDKIFQAILAAQKKVESAFAVTNSTIEEGVTRVRNAFIQYIGQSDSSLSATTRLTGALNYLADNFERTADVALKLAGIISAALLGRGIGKMIAFVPRAALALTALVTSLRAGALAAGTFSAAMGPIGLILGGVAAAIFLVASSQDEAEEAARAHKETLEKVTPVLRDLNKASDDAIQNVRSLGDEWIASARKAVASAGTQLQAMRSLAEADAAAFIGEAGGGRGVTFTDRDTDTAARIGEVAARDPRLKRALGELNDAANRLNEAEDAIKKIEQEAKDRGLPDPTTGEGGPSITTPPGLDQDALDKIQKVTDSLAFQSAQLQRTARDQAIYNALKDAGVTIDSAAGKAIAEAAGALYDQQKALEKNIGAMDDLRDSAKDMFSTFVDGIREGQSATEALGNAIDKLADKIIDSGLDSLVAGLFGTGGTRGTGILSTLASALFGGGRATGGTINPGQIYKVHKDELIVPRAPGRVIPARQASMGGTTAIQYSPSIVIQGSADDRAIRSMREGMLRDLQNTLPQMIKKARADRRLN